MSVDVTDPKKPVREPEEFVVLWHGRPEPLCPCDSPCLSRFATVIEVWPKFDSTDDVTRALNLVPTPADLAPWIMRLPEFVCHFCQGRPVRGAYLYQASLPGADSTLFCPKEYAVAAMNHGVMLTGVQPWERRRREAMHMAKTILGVEVAPTQITNSRSGVYDVTAVWESHAPVECSAAKEIWEARDQVWNQWRDEPAFKIAVDVWQSMEPEIDTAIRRLCQKRRRGVALGVFHGVPAICLDCVPVSLVKNECPEVCLRHPIVVGTAKQLCTQAGLDVDQGLSAPCAQMFSPILEQMLQKPLAANDYSAPLDRERLLKGGPGFGTGLPFTVSGLAGQHYLISETEVDQSESNAAAELLNKMLTESVKTGWLHHFHGALAFGRFNSDSRPGAEIPEVAAWVRALNERFPALWFFLDPDSLSWFYPAIYPDSLTKEGVLFELRNYARLCVRATSAAVEQIRASGCRADRLDSLLSQAATVKNVAAANHFCDVRSATHSQFEAFLAGSDIPKDLLDRVWGHASKFVADLVAGWVIEKAVASYSEGQVHAAHLIGPFAKGCPDSYLAFSFFPCSVPTAQDAYRRSGGYRKALEGMHSSDKRAKLFVERGIDTLVHVVVCHESLLHYSFHMTFLPWQAKEPAYTAPAFRTCD